jgi:hypothetical protein
MGYNKLAADPTALVLGIIGLVFLFLGYCCGLLCIVSLILGIVGWAVASKSLRNYNHNPEDYDHQSWKNVRFGKILCIVSVVISAIVMLVYIGNIIYFGYKISDQFTRGFKIEQHQIEDTIQKNQNQYKQTDSIRNDSLSFEYIN